MSQTTDRPSSGVTHTKNSRKAAKALLADLRKQLAEGKGK